MTPSQQQEAMSIDHLAEGISERGACLRAGLGMIRKANKEGRKVRSSCRGSVYTVTVFVGMGCDFTPTGRGRSLIEAVCNLGEWDAF